MIRVLIDLSACCGDGTCVELAPEVFEIDDGTGLAEIKEPEQPDGMRELLEETVTKCPTEAISIETVGS